MLKKTCKSLRIPVHKATGSHGFPYVTFLNPYIVT